MPDAELNTDLAVRNIATWYWELPTIPTWIQEQFSRISEIWAPTRFVQRAMRRYTHKQVLVIPPVVPVFPETPVSQQLRARLGVARNQTLFLTSFDYNSTVSRKNPLGVIKAFQLAFPRRTANGPLLVIKAINLDRDQRFTRDLSAAIRPVGGVLLSNHMTTEEIAGLFHACDVYVSLHRSEGFGLGMAESMAIGKTVIGTAYSGNLDFMSPANSCLIGYSLRPIDETDYLYNRGMEASYFKGALWAEPDVEQAAEFMAVLATDREERQRLGEAAKETMEARFSEQSVSRAATERLAQLAQ